MGGSGGGASSLRGSGGTARLTSVRDEAEGEGEAAGETEASKLPDEPLRGPGTGDGMPVVDERGLGSIWRAASTAGAMIGTTGDDDDGVSSLGGNGGGDVACAELSEPSASAPICESSSISSNSELVAPCIREGTEALRGDGIGAVPGEAATISPSLGAGMSPPRPRPRARGAGRPRPRARPAPAIGLSGEAPNGEAGSGLEATSLGVVTTTTANSSSGE